MKTLSTPSRLVAAAATALLLMTFFQKASAGGFVPLRLHSTITIQSLVPIGGDEHVVTMEVLATDAGWGTVFGHFTSVLHLVVDFDIATGLPLRGGGEVVQTNADGSTVTWENHFEGAQVGSRIAGGTGRFNHSQGWVSGISVLNEDGTVSTREEGWITGIGANLTEEP